LDLKGGGIMARQKKHQRQQRNRFSISDGAGQLA